MQFYTRSLVLQCVHGLFLVFVALRKNLFWSVLSRIRTKYGEFHSKSDHGFFDNYFVCVSIFLFLFTNIFNMTLHKKFPADLITFTEEILNGKPHVLCSVIDAIQDLVLYFLFIRLLENCSLKYFNCLI